MLEAQWLLVLVVLLEERAKSVLGALANLDNYAQIAIFLELFSDLLRTLATGFGNSLDQLLVADAGFEAFIVRSHLDDEEVEEVWDFCWVQQDA
jgi:hypothetical protein